MMAKPFAVLLAGILKNIRTMRDSPTVQRFVTRPLTEGAGLNTFGWRRAVRRRAASSAM